MARSFFRRPVLVGTLALCGIVAQPAFAAPTLFTFSPTLPLTGETVTFTSTDNTGPVNWDLDGDGACDDAQTPTVQRSFRVAGRYPVTLCATTPDGSASQTRMVTVANRAPTAAFTSAPAPAIAGDPVTFTSTASDPEGPLVSQGWDLDGDGQFDDAAGPSAAFTYALPGGYAVALRVVDADGAEHVARQTVAIAPRPPVLLSPFPLVRLLGDVSSAGTRVRRLTVRAPQGSRIEVHCRGRGCPVRRRTRSRSSRSSLARVRVRAERTVRLKRLERTFRAGTILTVRVTRAGAIGKYTRFRIRSGRPPARKDLCVAPAPKRLVRCP